MSYPRPFGVALAFGIGIACTLSCANGGEPITSAEVQRWLESEISISASATIDPILVSYKLRSQFSVTKDMRAREKVLRQEVGSAKDHPNAVELIMLSNRIESPLLISKHQFWLGAIDGKLLWRLNDDKQEGPRYQLAYADVASGLDSWWTNGAGNTAVFALSDKDTLQQREGVMTGALSSLRLVLFGWPLSFSEVTNAQIGNVIVDDSSDWKAVLRFRDLRGEDKSVALSGHWMTEHSVGFIAAWGDPIRIRRTPGTFLPKLRRVIPASITHTASNELTNEYSGISVEAIADSVLREVTRPPTVDGKDAVRGALRVETHADRSTTKGKSYLRGPHDELLSIETKRRGIDRREQISIWGWLLIPTMVVLAVAVRRFTIRK